MTFYIFSAALVTSVYLTLIAAAYLGVASMQQQEPRRARRIERTFPLGFPG